MKNSIEKKLYKNLLFIILLIIISIAISIALLAGITTQLAKLKKGKMDIVLKIFKIAEFHNFKQTLLKNTYLSYGNSKQFNSYLKLYYNEKNVQNITMRKTEKEIAKLSSEEDTDIANLYLKLYNLIKKDDQKEKEIIGYLKKDNLNEATKNYRLTYKNNENELNNILDNFNTIINKQTQSVKTISKGKILFSILINLFALIIFLIVAIKVIITISRHIAYLHKSAYELKNGNYETPITLNTNDELEELAVALDRMRQSFLKSIKFLHRKR